MREARMFHSTSPNRLYQDHQARVEAAVLRRARKLEARPVLGRGQALWQAVWSWLATVRAQVTRLLQPAEEGYIA
jgi:hypothetical protein